MKATRLIFGFGINDADYTVKTRTETCPYYQRWHNMIRRCNSNKYQELYPSYVGCTVSDKWKSFMNFRKWMNSQDWKGKCLDKDIIIPGNKVYSEESCCFVDHSVNCLLLDRSGDRGDHPVGVSFEKARKKFSAYLNKNGKRYAIGRFISANDASKAYISAKSDHILEIASRQSDCRIANGLAIHAHILRGSY